MKPRLLLVDGHSVAYRSYFAFVRDPLRNSRGQNTSAVFGFANTLRKLLDELAPTHCAVAFDAPGPTFRHERFGDYKLQRPPTPAELAEQLPIVKRMVAAWGIRACEVPGVEADDVLGTLARSAAGQGLEVTIASSDKDLLQLVGPGITVLDPWSGKAYGPAEVREKLGVGPEQVADYLALAGDSSDNVPGVPGIGPKRARVLLERHGGLDCVLAGEPKLAGHRELAELSRELVRIDDRVRLDVTVGDLALGERDVDALRGLFEELEFRKLVQELSPVAAATTVEPLDRVRVESAAKVAVARDAEGGWAVAVGTGGAMAVPADAGAWLAGVLARPGALKVGWGLKELLREAELAGPLFDAGVAAWLADPNRGSYDPAAVAEQALGRAAGGAAAAELARTAFDVEAALGPEIDAAGLRAVLDEIEMPLLPVLARMERRGVRIDIDHFRELEAELGTEIAGLEREIHELAGAGFNVASPRQLGEVLFERLGLARGRRTKTGFSTNSAVLAGLADAHPVVPKVLRFRELSKLKGTYLSPLIECADPASHRIHTTFNQTGAATGRLSSSNPNLQSIPIRSELGHRIRAGFVADAGMALVSADYSQVELRVLAHLSGDEALRRAFAAGEDIHVQTAATVFHLEPGEVTPEHRRLAKVVNYGLIYGMGDYGLASRMGMPLEEARAFLDSYMASFAGVADWRERVVAEALERGQVRTIAGRVRPVAAIASRNRNVADAASRAAINAPVQGSAADIIKRAMVRVDERLESERIEPGMLLQVHDELLFEVAERDVERARALVRDEMESAWRLDVPLVAEVGSGRNWDEAH
ncbi:MAG: DNA polymerase I [bacterium]